MWSSCLRCVAGTVSSSGSFTKCDLFTLERCLPTYSIPHCSPDVTCSTVYAESPSAHTEEAGAPPGTYPTSWAPFGAPSAGENASPGSEEGEGAGKGNEERKVDGGSQPKPSSAGPGGADASDDKGGAEGKLDLRRSAEIVRAGLKDFRASRAAKVCVCV